MTSPRIPIVSFPALTITLPRPSGCPRSPT